MSELPSEIVKELRGTELLSDVISRKYVFTLLAQFRKHGQFDVIVKNIREVELKLITIEDVDYSYQISAHYIPNVWYITAKVFCGGDYVEIIESVTGHPLELVNIMMDMLETYYLTSKNEFDEQVKFRGWWKSA